MSETWTKVRSHQGWEVVKVLQDEGYPIAAICQTESDADTILADHDAAADRDSLRQALEALAKAQYDGTVEGLRYQMDREDWGDILNPDEMRTAYELTLAALSPDATGDHPPPDEAAQA